MKATETQRPGPGCRRDRRGEPGRTGSCSTTAGRIQIRNKAHTGDQPYFTKDTVVRNGDTVDFPAEGDDAAATASTTGACSRPCRSTARARRVAQADLRGREPAPRGPRRPSAATCRSPRSTSTTTSRRCRARTRTRAARRRPSSSRSSSPRSSRRSTASAPTSSRSMEIENSVRSSARPSTPPLAEPGRRAQRRRGRRRLGLRAHARRRSATPAITDVDHHGDHLQEGVRHAQGRQRRPSIDETVWGNAREPIAQTFQTSAGRVLSLVANHLKSKSPPTGAGAEPADGQGFFNADRVAQAKAELAFAKDVQKSSGSGDVFLVGDFNAYGKEDPIDVFTQAGWTDVEPTFAQGQYTYSFDGELGSLDHVIASPVRGEGDHRRRRCGTSTRRSGATAATRSAPPRRARRTARATTTRSSSALKGAADPVDIDVATINDFHGRIEADGAAAGAAVLAGAVEADPGAEPEHDLRGRGRPHRRLDVHVVHPAGQPDDRRAQRGRSRRERGGQPRVRPGLRRPPRPRAEPRATGPT